MIVKNAMKIKEKDCFEDIFEIKKGDEGKDFIKEMLSEFKSNGVKEYGEKISIEKLNRLLPEEVKGKYDELTTKAIKINEKGKYFAIAFMFFAVLDMFSLLYFGNNVEAVKVWLMAAMIFLGLSMMVIFILYVKIRAYEKSFSIDVKDESGEDVKAIWFLYHNVPFKDEKQKYEFMKDNYSRFNYYLKIKSEKCLKWEVNPSDYLENFKDRVLACLEEGSED